MKILVTGGAGYIGSVVTEQLIAAGESVIVFDNLSQGHRQAVHPEAVFVEGDLAHPQAITDVLKTYQPEAIMHFASHTLAGESMEQPFLYLGDNVMNGLNLLQSAVEQGVRHFILSSTANLFDDPAEIPIQETEKIVPGSPYGESKYILERYLTWMNRIYDLRYACLRYFNAAGATEAHGEDHNPETHLIPTVLQVALGQRDNVYIFGDDYPTRDGTCVRDYIHVLDLAHAHILALHALELDNASGQSNRVYNLGNGKGFTVKEVIETARNVTGHPIPAVVSKRRPGDPAKLIASSDKIRQELGWVPQYPDLQTIVESAWRWHKAHPHGYEA